MFRRLLKLFSRRLGFDIVRWPNQLELFGHLKTLFINLQPDLVLDIGANEGQFASRLRETANYRGKILSYEPTPDTYRSLMNRCLSDPLWSAENLAVGATPGSLELKLYNESKWNSTRTVDHRIAATTGRRLIQTGSIEVGVVRLDACWPADSGRVFLKSDTQGSEVEVLKSLGHRVEDVVGMLLEAPLRGFYEQEPTFCEVVELAMSLGFHPTGFFPVSRARKRLDLDTVDVTFVGSKYISDLAC